MTPSTLLSPARIRIAGGALLVSAAVVLATAATPAPSRHLDSATPGTPGTAGSPHATWSASATAGSPAASAAVHPSPTGTTVAVPGSGRPGSATAPASSRPTAGATAGSTAAGSSVEPAGGHRSATSPSSASSGRPAGRAFAPIAGTGAKAGKRSAPAKAGTASGTAESCGGSTPRKADGSLWICSFDDEFSGTALDTSKWTVQTTEASGFHSGAECFTDSPHNIAVSGGTLRLTVRKEAAPFSCASPRGAYQTQYTSGTVNGFGKFAQAYGRFEVRAQLPSATVPGLQETLWLWPTDQFKYGAWPSSGEIDFGEFYSKYPGWAIPYLHYDVLQSTVNWATNTNVYTALPAPYAQPGMNCRINQSAFNTYTLTWQPGRLVIAINGQNCIVDNYAATGLSGAAPFDQPFFIALTQALGIGENAPTANTPLPATTQVDYVRIWR